MEKARAAEFELQELKSRSVERPKTPQTPHKPIIENEKVDILEDEIRRLREQVKENSLESSQRLQENSKKWSERLKEMENEPFISEELKKCKEKVESLQKEVETLNAEKSQLEENMRKLKQQNLQAQDILDEKSHLEKTISKLEARFAESKCSCTCVLAYFCRRRTTSDKRGS